MSHLNPLWGLLGIRRGLKGPILPPKNPLLGEKLLSTPGPKSDYFQQLETSQKHRKVLVLASLEDSNHFFDDYDDDDDDN